MKLSHFIKSNLEAILEEWDVFARTLGPAAEALSDVRVRDHAKLILEAVATDIDVAQSDIEQAEKSKGRAPDELESAASEHGKGRHEDGFTISQMVAEYRALRATVLRLWLAQVEHVTAETTGDMLRFNEAIDQAVAESTARFTEQTERTRDTFLAILGHDLRTPLAAISMAANFLTMTEAATPRIVKVASGVKRSVSAMSAMVNDLLEYARSQLGSGIPVAPKPTDMQVICIAALEEVGTAFPDCQFELQTSGDLTGDFDSARLRQALINLMTNAVQYREKDYPVRVSAYGEADAITLQVQNRGPVIPRESLQAIFDPLVQLAGSETQEGRPSTSLGLGLFIAREITEAHEGAITAESSENSGTTFTIRLPRGRSEKSGTQQLD